LLSIHQLVTTIDMPRKIRNKSGKTKEENMY